MAFDGALDDGALDEGALVSEETVVDELLGVLGESSLELQPASRPTAIVADAIPTASRTPADVAINALKTPSQSPDGSHTREA